MTTKRQYGLVINPGSTSTKVAVFKGLDQVFAETIPLSRETLARFSHVADQQAFRREQILEALRGNGVSLSDIAGVIGIGGWLHPAAGGVFEVNDDVYHDLSTCRYMEHVSNLGGVVARDIADGIGVKAYVADPVTTDEITDAARLSGMPLLPRSGKSHALNQKRIAMETAAAMGKAYGDARLIVAHLGGGISVAAHAGGRMLDTNSARGEGPFSIDRCGGINTWEIAQLCFSGTYSQREVLSMINGNGGIVAYLGLTDFKAVMELVEGGNARAAQVVEAMAHQIAKEVGAMATVLEGRVDAMAFTGGMAHAEAFIASITRRVGFIAPVHVFPGENEMRALAEYLDKALHGRIAVQSYRKEE
jgi:butyrate kinase